MKELNYFYDIRNNNNWRRDTVSIKSYFFELLIPKQKE